MAMDAAWKVYVGDRRFDDNQISNCFLKMKYETVGRFTFDFRAIDGDESYMVVGNTLRIFWGDLHKMDGVIQRADWDSKQFCYHVYGADIRGFLLDRVNTEPATVSSYTSDVQSYVQYEGCDFPSNIWTGAGEQIGKYTFHYKIGIQNTIRITGATQNRWYTVVERGTVYDHVNGCLYDATKNWATNEHRGRVLRFISGACKNNVYNINGNTANRVCIRLPGEPAPTETGTLCERALEYGSAWYYNSVREPGFETGTLWTPYWTAGFSTVGIVEEGYDGGSCLYAQAREKGLSPGIARVKQNIDIAAGGTITFKYKILNSQNGSVTGVAITRWTVGHPGGRSYRVWAEGLTNPSWPDWDTATITGLLTGTGTLGVGIWANDASAEVWVDDINYYSSVSTTTDPCGATGTVPGCSRIGDIYEIVFASMARIEPASLVPATLEKDNHIIRYNRVNSLSDHVTSMTIRGT